MLLKLLVLRTGPSGDTGVYVCCVFRRVPKCVSDVPSCDTASILVTLDGFLLTDYLTQWRPQVTRGGEFEEGEGGEGGGMHDRVRWKGGRVRGWQVLEVSIRSAPPDEFVREGLHSLGVSIMCGVGDEGGFEGGGGGQQAKLAESEFEMVYVRRPFHVADLSQGMEDCLTNSSLVPAGLAHVFDPDLQNHVIERVTNELLPNVQPGDVILDVGGNIGESTRRLRAEYPHAHVHVFEPLQTLAEKLEKLFSNDDHVTVHAYGLSRHSVTTNTRGVCVCACACACECACGCVSVSECV